MGMYFGRGKVKIVTDGAKQGLKFLSVIPITNGIRLVSSDEYVLKDSKGLYLTIKESE